METAKLPKRIGFCRYHFEQIHPWDFRNWKNPHVSSRFLPEKNKTRVVLCSWQKHVESAGWRCLHKSGTHDPEQDRRWWGGPCSDPKMAWNLQNEDLQSRTTTDQHESQWNHEKKIKKNNIKHQSSHCFSSFFISDSDSCSCPSSFHGPTLTFSGLIDPHTMAGEHSGGGDWAGWIASWIWFFVFGSY